MKNIIYYFTATGNSLYVAREISKSLKQCSLLPMAKFVKDDKITISGERIGFIFPLYYSGIPEVVEEFIKKIHINSKYVFAIATRGVTQGHAMKQVDEILSEKGIRLSYNEYITMPANYVRMYDMKSPKKNKEIIENASKKIEIITSNLLEYKNNIVKKPILYKIIRRTLYKSWRNKLKTMDNKFYSDEKCNSCGICLKVCPVSNISLIDNRPMWSHRCQDCMACVHLCPKKAIQIGKVTVNRGRYKNPYVSIQDIINQKY